MLNAICFCFQFTISIKCYRWDIFVGTVYIVLRSIMAFFSNEGFSLLHDSFSPVHFWMIHTSNMNYITFFFLHLALVIHKNWRIMRLVCMFVYCKYDNIKLRKLKTSYMRYLSECLVCASENGVKTEIVFTISVLKNVIRIWFANRKWPKS